MQLRHQSTLWTNSSEDTQRSLRDHQFKCCCCVPIFHPSGYHAGFNASLNAQQTKVDGAIRLVQQQQKILTEVALLIICIRMTRCTMSWCVGTPYNTVLGNTSHKK